MKLEEHSNSQAIQPVYERLLQAQNELLMLGSTEQITNVLNTIANSAHNILGGHHCVVQPYDELQDKFLLEQFTAAGHAKALAFDWTEPRPNGTARMVLNSKSGTLLVDNYDKGVDTYPFLEGGAGAFRDIADIQSFIGLRLDIAHEKVGVLFVNYPEPRDFTEEDIQIARLFANLAASAIKSARLYENTSRYNAQLGELLEIATDLTTAFTIPQNVLDKTIRRTVDLLGATRGAILLYENSGNLGRIVSAFDKRLENQSQEVGQIFPDSLLQQEVRKTLEPIILHDVEDHHLLTTNEKERMRRIGTSSTIIVPLKARGKVIGSIGLDFKESRHVFSPDEQRVAQILADFAAIAIDNARIHGVAEDELSNIIIVTEEILSKVLEPGIRLEQFLQFVVETTLRLLNFDAGWLLLREGDLVKIYATDEAHKNDKGRTFALTDSITGLAILKQETIHIQDLHNISEEYAGVYKTPAGTTIMRSELAVPLLVGEDAIGAFDIESAEPAAFGSRHEDVLQLLGRHVALAIKLFRSQEERESLTRIGLELATQTEMDTVVRLVLDHTRELVGAQFGQVLLRIGDYLEVRHTTNMPPNDLGIKVSIDGSISGLAVQERRPVIVPNVEKSDYIVVSTQGELVEKRTPEPQYKRALETEKVGMLAELAVPISLNGRIIGVVNVETPSQQGFTQYHQEELVAFIKTYAERFQEGLLHHDRSILGPLLRGALVRTETNYGQILHLVDNKLIIEETSGGEDIGTEVSINASISGRSVRQRTPIYISDVSLDPDYQRYLGKAMTSELAVPLLLGENMIGVLNVESPIRSFFTVEHAKLLEAFSGYAAIAIERARTIRELTQAEKEAVSRDIIHRLNNPLGAISMRIEILQKKSFYSKLLSDYQYVEQFIERTVRDLGSAKSIIQELRRVVQAQEPAPMRLQEAIHQGLVQAQLPEQIHVEHITLDEPIFVIANNRLPNIFWNLFDNARKAMPERGTLKIEEIFPTGDWVFVRVTDTGRGIEPFRLPFIFEPGESTTPDTYAPAHGFGLFWVKQQMASIGGEVSVESKLGEGTTITIKLRKAHS